MVSSPHTHTQKAKQKSVIIVNLYDHSPPLLLLLILKTFKQKVRDIFSFPIFITFKEWEWAR